MRKHTHAYRIIGFVFALALSLSFAACGGSETKPSGGGGGASEPTTLVNTWASGADRLILNGDGTYSWTRTRACKTPPCPQQTTTGRWEDRRGQLYLNPKDGDDKVLSYTLSGGSLSLSGGGESFSYTKQ